MNFSIKTKRSAITMKKVYYVSDSEDMYGPFDKYKEATDFMEEQIGLLYEHGAVCGIPEGEDNHYRE